VGDKPTGVLAVKVFVKSKFPAGSVARALALPKNVDGLPVDVEETGTLRAFAKRRKRAKAAASDDTMPNPRVRMRPAPAGCSVGFRIPGDEFVMCGTFGAVVKTARKVFILSNNHVLADENRLPIGSRIFQPALMDGGSIQRDQIAKLTRFIRLKPNRSNRIDAAIAEALNKNLLDKELLHIGAPKGTAQAELDMMVHKFGRTTSYTLGRIHSIDTDVIVEYETADFTFDNQIIIRGSNNTMFSDSGDSGSIILQRGTNKAVGLLFGGSSTHTIANHIRNVLRSLRVRMA
jgi:Peptidase family S64